MNALRAAARLLTGSTYALLASDAFWTPGGRVEMADPVLASLPQVAPLPSEDEMIVRGNAAVQVIAGALLAAGKAPRISALALTGSLIPTTLAGHRFWAMKDPAARAQQRIQFHQNMALLGGLLLAVLDRPDDSLPCNLVGRRFGRRLSRVPSPVAATHA